VLMTLQTGKDMSGFDLDGAPDFSIGCTIAPFADGKGRDAALITAAENIKRGARYIVTPPIFDMAGSADFLVRLKELGVPIIAKVFLLKSLAIAQYIANSDPGAGISDELIKRVRKSSNRELGGIKIAGETVLALKEQTQGVLIQTLGWEHRLPEILDVAKI